MGQIWSCEDRSPKDPTWFPGCCLPGEGVLLGMAAWRRILWVCIGVYTHISCRGRSLSLTSCFFYASCFIESCWIMNRATKTSVLQAASLLLFYKMPLTSKCKSLEPVSRRLRGGRRITQSLCWLLTPFLWHIQYKFCAQFSFISVGHWKSGFVPELFSSQRGLGKRGKKDFASGYGPLLANGADQTTLFVVMAQCTSTLLHFRVLWVYIWMCSFSVHMLAASSCGSGTFSQCQW